ncbi:MAG TPA: hypothetical protein VHZ97_12440 [Pseudonocardiaceae bacterium]|nr:hypothetical protein [Pseudonocardiaceae bacterium]
MTSALAGLLLAGCASGPDQAGSAAIVNGTAISLDSIQAQLNNYLANPPSASGGQQPSPADEARSIVSFAVLDKIDNAAVAKYHLNVPAQAVTEYTNELGGIDKLVQSTGYTAPELQMILRDRVVQMAYASKYVPGFEVTFDSFVVTDQKSATTLTQKLSADPANARSILTAAAAGAQSQPQFGTKLTGGEIMGEQTQSDQQAQQGGGTSGSEEVLPLFEARSNSVLTFPVAQGQWVVLVVHNADTNGTPSDSDKTALSQVTSDNLYEAGTFLLSPLAQDLSIKISPRYGVWDTVGMSVVASAGQLGVELPNKA